MHFDLNSYFHAVDYAIFGGMLAISALIGIYFAFFAKQKQDNTKEYLMGSKTLGFFPISMSLIASNISGISMMGLPAEVYIYGTQLWLVIVPETIAYVFGAYSILPVLYNLEITSSYEYLERRFNSTLRKLGSLFFLIGNMLYIPIVVYVPALAFSQVSGLGLDLLIPLCCVVCTFYTTLGGMKAVVWTDTFQTVMIFLGVASVAIIGTIHVGGIPEIWRRAEDGGRIEFFNMSMDLTVRHTFWCILIGKFVGNLSLTCTNQSMVQRCLAMPTLKQARITIFVLTFGTLVLMCFCFFSGLIIFASFHDCDPVSVGTVKKFDSIVAYFIMKFTTDVPAIPGIFMAGVFSAALSSLSTCMNSMCGVLYEDFVKPNLKTAISEKRASFYMKVMVVIIGFVTMVLASIVEKLSTVVQTSSSLSAITLGTLLGIYILGIFIPWSNGKGALWGGIIGSLVVSWISLGAQNAIRNRQLVYPTKEFLIDGCDNASMTSYYLNQNATISIAPMDLGEPFWLYKISYVWYTPIGVLITVVVGVAISWATGFQDPDELDLNLICPWLRSFFRKTNRFKPNLVRFNSNEAKKLIVR